MTLERRTPLRRTGLVRKVPVNPKRVVRTAVRRTSRQRDAEAVRYAKLRESLLPTGCRAGAALAVHGVFGCTGEATELHHRRKLSSAGAFTHPSNVVPVCHSCNQQIENYPHQAEAAGLVIREGHAEWDELGARRWRKA